MTKFASVNETGHLLGFYDTEDGAPPPFDDDNLTLVEVSDEQFEVWMSNTSLIIIDGELVDNNDPVSKEQLLDYLANLRWKVETGGVNVGGMQVATDDRSKTMLLGARIAADANPNHTISWKMPDGSWGELSSTQIIYVSNAVLDHVHQCFAKELEVSNLIEDGDIVGFEGVELAFST